MTCEPSKLHPEYVLPPQGGSLRRTHPVRFSVFLKEQDPAQDDPRHETSREFAVLIVCVRDARAIGQNAIQLTTSESWRELKARLRGRRAEQEITKLLPPLDHYLPYNYPLPYELLKMYRHV